MARAKRKPDSEIQWDQIERDYRAGLKSLSQIAREHEVSRDRIKRRADKEGWERNLSQKINEAAKNKLNELSAQTVAELPEAETEEERNRQIVELAAQTQVELVRHHREDIGTMRHISRKMMGKLDEALDKGLQVTSVDEQGEPTGEPMFIGMDLETAGKVFNNLTNGYQRLVQLERQAFGMDEKDKGGDASSEMQTAFEMILAKKDGLPCEMMS